MKQLYKYLMPALIVVSLYSSRVMAQWSGNPDEPLAICSYSSNQTNPQIIADGSEGFFIFWLDNRNTNIAIYGQHLNKNGMALWEENGRAIFDNPAINYTRVNALLNNDNDILITWQSASAGGFEDTLYAAKLNSDGDLLWPAPVKIAGNNISEGGGYWGPVESDMIEIGNNYYFGIVTTGYGFVFLSINKLGDDGSLPWGYNGYQLPDIISAGNIKLLPDGAGGCFMKWDYYHSYLQRFDEDGNLLWGTPTDVNSCTSGAGGTYAGFPYFLIESDGAGGIMSAWSSLDDDIYAADIDADGAPVFDDGCIPVYVDAYAQEEISFSKSGDNYYLGWVDSRPDASGIYMQKFNQDGEIQWAEELYVEDTSFYIPVIKSITTTEGDIAIFYQAAGAFYAQKIHPDGTTEWAQPIEVLSDYFQPFYTHYELQTSENGNVIGVAETVSISGDQNVYAFNLNFSGGDTIHEDTSGTAIRSFEEQINLYPNPADQFVQVEQSTQNELRFEVYDLSGKCILNDEFAGSEKIDLSNVKNGMYFIHFKYAERDEIQKLIVIHNSRY